jgi:hypothetical protein
MLHPLPISLRFHLWMLTKKNPTINGYNHNANPIQMFASKLLDLEKL